MLRLLLLAGLVLGGCAATPSAQTAATCAADPAHWAQTSAGCLAIQSYCPAQADTLVVVLHGDLSGGGPASYHRAIARRVAETVPGVAVAALVRPGYADEDGRTSDGSLNGRSDLYTRANVNIVADAIGALRRRAGARRVVAIGHSGGAATAADILAVRDGTVDAAVLLACPCDLRTWRATRRPWTMSLDPIVVADDVPRSARVAAYTGTADTNTAPELAEAYVQRLAARGVDARFTAVPGATHNGIVDAVWATDFPQTLRSFVRP